jgi:hypothetical protein
MHPILAGHHGSVNHHFGWFSQPFPYLYKAVDARERDY